MEFYCHRIVEILPLIFYKEVFIIKLLMKEYSPTLRLEAEFVVLDTIWRSQKNYDNEKGTSTNAFRHRELQY